MIAKGKIRGEGGKLAVYLMTGENGERAQLIEARGLDSFGGEPVAAFEAMEAFAQAHTRCKLPFFHEQIRIAPNERLTDAQWIEAVDRSEKHLGFTGQARLVSFHINEATGEKHLHAAWFRVDMEAERAIDPGMFKNHLKQLSRKLEREFAIRELSNDRPAERRARAADRKEFEESRRLETDVNAIRTAILDCYQQSDGGKAFRAALDAQGLELATGDRRDCFVVIDQAGGHHALNKKLTGQTLAAIREKLADLERSQLPSVEQAKAMQAERHPAHEAGQEPRQQPEPRPGMENHQAAAAGPYTELHAAQTESQFTTEAGRATEPTAPVWDRDADNAAWEARLADAAQDAARTATAARQQEKHGRDAERDGPAAEGKFTPLQTHEAAPEAKPERELSETAGQIRLAWTLSRTAGELEDAFAAHGIGLARVSTEEAYASERRAALSKEAGNFAPAWREGEIGAVDGFGHVHRLNERTTGEKDAALGGRFVIDANALMDVAATQEAMRAASLEAWKAERRAEREEKRPASSIETTVDDALRGTMTGTDFAAALDGKGLTIARVTAADEQALAALRQADIAAGTTGDLASGRRFAEVLPGDLAAVTRQGDVFRLSPQKLDFEEIEQRLADVQARLPSVIEARAGFEEIHAQQAKERAKHEAEFIAGRLEQAEMRAGERELQQATRGAERAVEAAIETPAEAMGKTARKGGQAARIAARVWETAFNLMFGAFMAAPKDTQAQAEQKAQAAGNVETLHAEAVASHAAEVEAERDERISRADSEQQAPLAAPGYFRTVTRPADPAERRRQEQQHEHERER